MNLAVGENSSFEDRRPLDQGGDFLTNLLTRARSKRIREREKNGLCPYARNQICQKHRTILTLKRQKCQKNPLHSGLTCQKRQKIGRHRKTGK